MAGYEVEGSPDRILWAFPYSLFEPSGSYLVAMKDLLDVLATHGVPVLPIELVPGEVAYTQERAALVGVMTTYPLELEQRISLETTRKADMLAKELKEKRIVLQGAEYGVTARNELVVLSVNGIQFHKPGDGFPPEILERMNSLPDAKLSTKTSTVPQGDDDAFAAAFARETLPMLEKVGEKLQGPWSNQRWDENARLVKANGLSPRLFWTSLSEKVFSYFDPISGLAGPVERELRRFFGSGETTAASREVADALESTHRLKVALSPESLERFRRDLDPGRFSALQLGEAALTDTEAAALPATTIPLWLDHEKTLLPELSGRILNAVWSRLHAGEPDLGPRAVAEELAFLATKGLSPEGLADHFELRAGAQGLDPRAIARQAVVVGGGLEPEARDRLVRAVDRLPNPLISSSIIEVVDRQSGVGEEE
jgi:hypothetical protein